MTAMLAASFLSWQHDTAREPLKIWLCRVNKQAFPVSQYSGGCYVCEGGGGIYSYKQQVIALVKGKHYSQASRLWRWEGPFNGCFAQLLLSCQLYSLLGSVIFIFSSCPFGEACSMHSLTEPVCTGAGCHAIRPNLSLSWSPRNVLYLRVSGSE